MNANLATSPWTTTLSNRFASEVSELAVPWRAAEVEAPRLLALNEPLATELGFDPAALRTPEGLQLLVGNLLPEGATPIAQAYSGHQWGVYTPRLGDGRALLLGEVTDRDGTLRDLHLKGSGATPFSRGGDGLAAVGPMLREYLVSEAMHALGVPATRSLAVVGTGTHVRREDALPGALLVRVATSHLRVGTFQFARSTDDADLLRRLADHAIDRHAPYAAQAEHPYLALYEAVIEAQAQLVAKWMQVGFVHGVMSTDNMAISGETIDLGPCAFLDEFDPNIWFSSIDPNGRYAYRNQPNIAQWNLARFAEALLPILDDDTDRAIEFAQDALAKFAPAYDEAYQAGMRDKLGISHVAPGDAVELLKDLLELLGSQRVDYTQFFRGLGATVRSGRGTPSRSLFDDPAPFEAWAERWRALEPDTVAMDRVNPLYIARNHLVEEALAAASDDGDLEPFEQLLSAVQSPFEPQAGLERYAEPAPRDFGPYITYCGT